MNYDDIEPECISLREKNNQRCRDKLMWDKILAFQKSRRWRFLLWLLGVREKNDGGQNGN